MKTIQQAFTSSRYSFTHTYKRLQVKTRPASAKQVSDLGCTAVKKNSQFIIDFVENLQNRHEIERIYYHQILIKSEEVQHARIMKLT